MSTLSALVASVNVALAAALPGSVWQGLAVAIPMAGGQQGQGHSFKMIEIATGAPATLSDTTPTNGFHHAADARYTVGGGRGAGNATRKAAAVQLLVYSTNLNALDTIETVLAGLPNVTLVESTTDPARVNAALLGLEPQTHDNVSRLLALITYAATVQVPNCLPAS